MSLSVELVLYWIANQADPAQKSHEDARSFLDTIHDWTVDEVDIFVQRIAEIGDLPLLPEVQIVLGALCRNVYAFARQGSLEQHQALLKRAGILYQRMGVESQERHLLLAAMAIAGEREAIQNFALLFAADPPVDPLHVGIAMAPLFQRADFDAEELFPEILKALAHPHAASAALDLANFLFRNRRAAVHPAAEQFSQLNSLLKGVCARLKQVAVGEPDQQPTQHQIAESIAIAASLCDALGLIGDPQAKTALRDALEVPHRRIRVEAAAALARMEDDDAVAALVELAEHPGVRLRAIAYAEELGLLEHIDPQLSTPLANAEAELACYLAEPQQLGSAPTSMELIDEREIAWPSYDHPQQCYLFRFTYQMGEASYTNVGMAGPLVHAFHVDLTRLPIDDLYAIFAGWQAEHPDIREIPASQMDESHQELIEQLSARIMEQGLQLQTLSALGEFFGEPALIATASDGENVGAVVAGINDAAWFPHDGSSTRPLGPDEAWCIWKGRRLLSAFNE